MAEMTSIKMSKFDNQPWGFRLQGGIDFCAPLTVQKVNGGSLAEKAGLRVGDALIRVNTTDIFQLRHKEAQDAVARAGNNFELVVSRGGGMPKTAVKPSDVIDNILPVQAPPAPVQQPLIHKSLNLTAKPFVRSTHTMATSVSFIEKKTTKETECNNNNNNNNYLTSPPSQSDTDYSSMFSSNPSSLSSSNNSLNNKCITPDETSRAKELISQRLSVMRIHPASSSSPPVRSANSSPLVNTPASPSSLTFNKSNNKTDGSGVKMVNRQFNSPMGLYSEESIAETLSSQAEVLSQGVLGVNFKKNDKTYDPGNSEVFKMIQEMDKAPKEPEPGIDIDPADASPAQKGLASRTIQSRTFQRIHQQALRSLESSASSNPTSPLLSPNTSMEDRHQHMAHSATPTHKPMSFNSPVSMAVNNFGGGALSPSAHHPPPVGGVRIFPVAPAPAPAKPQVKPAAIQGPAPPAVKSVSFTPAARPSGFGSAAAVAASAAMAAQAQHQQQQALPPQLPPQMPQQPPKGAGSGIQSAPRRGKGVLNQQVAAGARVPVCASCKAQIRGKFVTALGQTWCPNHFSCAMPDCKRELHDIGFVEEKKQLYCEGCFETHLAPNCSRCSKRVKGDCLNAIGKQFHPECFSCTYCGSLFGNSHFYLEDGLPYCEADWNELFTTKCYACGYPIEAGDRWVEAMNNNYHSQCFNCSVCKKNLEGQSFLGKSGRPMCKSHAR
ncbi:PDZ and LIM domain protein Zasp-like isoform X7 [Daphnia pulicaria]|uniref:PDZ and LIM domain protein Zasp-like isoform X7 n=1 Tax=Daphnia pulicaria TaxID=35523 RepID=UPI001EEBB08E|nr:PDZ and LIM domain protein Zasp-like isoform X7 [Daphnia pulicaria]